MYIYIYISKLLNAQTLRLGTRYTAQTSIENRQAVPTHQTSKEVRHAEVSLEIPTRTRTANVLRNVFVLKSRHVGRNCTK